MAERHLTFRALAAATRKADPTGAGLSRGYLGNLVRGDDEHPSAEAIELIAAALGVDPDHFVEYRLAKARAQLDEREVGLEEALKNLDRLNGGRR